MSTPAPKLVPLIVAMVLIALAAIVALLVSDVRVLSCLAAIAAGTGVGCLYLLPPAAPARSVTGDAAVVRNIAESRNEVINAMSILQQEIRLLQSTNSGATEKKALLDEISHNVTELAALKQVVQLQRK